VEDHVPNVAEVGDAVASVRDGLGGGRRHALSQVEVAHEDELAVWGGRDGEVLDEEVEGPGGDDDWVLVGVASAARGEEADPRWHLSLRILANSEARKAGGRSRPSDRPGGRSRSCFLWSFCKITLELKRNQPAVQVPLSENFAKNLSAFVEINP